MSNEFDRRYLPVPAGLSGERLDVGLTRLLGISRSLAAKLAEEEAVLVDGTVARKSDRLVADTWLEVFLPREAPPTEEIDAQTVAGMPILYDDDDIVAVDKPVGIAAHSSVGWTGPTVLGVLKAAGYRITTSGAAERQGIVQRLDVGTSGVMVVAKSELAYSVLKHAFRQRTVIKHYHALVQGHPDPLSGTIDAPIGRHPGHDYKFAVTRDGRASITHYDVIEAFAAASLLKVNLETGRTHQIRVHFSALRHPLVGDLTYGGDPRLAKELGLQRQWLHAVGIEFEHPTRGHWVKIESQYPPDLTRALQRLATRA